MWVACYAAAAILGVRLLHVQVIRNVYYSRVAESNRTQVLPQTAPRGRIYDRNGETLATSRPAFSLIYLPAKKQDDIRLRGLAASLAPELRREEADLLDLLRQAQKEGSAIHLAENLPLKTMIKLSELKNIYPGVDLTVEARRFYPKKSLAGHLLGYMGKMDKRSWKVYKKRGYRVDSWVGRFGIEAAYEAELRGQSGEVRMEVDAQGRLKRKLGQSPWKPGGNIHLTIDARIQETVEKGLRESQAGKGAAVVLDPRSGEVLALASAPDFDPNLFLLPEWAQAKQQLKSLPEFNRAVSGTYAPGSTFKIIVGAAMLEEGKVRPEDKVYCGGSTYVGRRRFRCWEKKGHGRVSWLKGITESCDVYFYQMGLRTGGDLIEKYSKRFGLGSRILASAGSGRRPILTGENKGNIFGPAARKARKLRWHDGDTANLSIGQGELLVTPLQMAVVIAAVANGGTLVRPHFVKRIEYADGRTVALEEPEPLGRVELSEKTWSHLREGLRSVVTSGTGRRLNLRNLVVGGKTGTAENPHGDDHAWFVAYAGREGEPPSVAVSILAENGGHGSSGAGPIARAAIEAAFRDPESAGTGYGTRPPVQAGAPDAGAAMTPDARVPAPDRVQGLQVPAKPAPAPQRRRDGPGTGRSPMPGTPDSGTVPGTRPLEAVPATTDPESPSFIEPSASGGEG